MMDDMAYHKATDTHQMIFSSLKLKMRLNSIFHSFVSKTTPLQIRFSNERAFSYLSVPSASFYASRTNTIPLHKLTSAINMPRFNIMCSLL